MLRHLILITSIFIAFFFSGLAVQARELTASDIEPKIKRFIVNHYKTDYKGQIEVNCGRIPGLPLKVDEGKLEITLKSSLRDDFIPRTVVRVAIYVDGKYQRAFGVPVTLALYDDVWVATQPILRGDAISAANVELKRKDISKLAGTAAKPTSNLQGTRVRKTFTAGEILDHRFIEKDPIVVRNALVEIIFQSSTVSIAIPGHALENGNMGDIVRVKSKEFNKEYIGTVIDRGIILVNI